MQPQQQLQPMDITPRATTSLMPLPGMPGYAPQQSQAPQAYGQFPGDPQAWSLQQQQSAQQQQVQLSI